MISPSAVSATRCWGCQPVRAVADFETSSAERNAWRVNGLAAIPAPAQRSQDDAAMSLMAGKTRTRISVCGLGAGGAPGAGAVLDMLGSEPFEYHLVGVACGHRAVFLAAHRPGKQRQGEHKPRRPRRKGRKIVHPVGDEVGAAFQAMQEKCQFEL